jgi:hypothetical protein
MTRWLRCIRDVDQNTDENLEGLAHTRINNVSNGVIEGNLPSFLEAETAKPDIYYIRMNNIWLSERLKIIQKLRNRMRYAASRRSS